MIARDWTVIDNIHTVEKIWADAGLGIYAKEPFIYTQATLVSFGNYILERRRDGFISKEGYFNIHDADIRNWEDAVGLSISTRELTKHA